jgi:hypothetical protein
MGKGENEMQQPVTKRSEEWSPTTLSIRCTDVDKGAANNKCNARISLQHKQGPLKHRKFNYIFINNDIT